MRKDTADYRLKLTDHHVYPTSRIKENKKERKCKVSWPRYFHEAWHSLYANSLMKEVRVINEIVNIPEIILTPEGFSKLLYIDCRIRNPRLIIPEISEDGSLFNGDAAELAKHFIFRVVGGRRVNGTHSFMPSSLEVSWQTMFNDLTLDEICILIEEMNNPGSVWPHERIIMRRREIKNN